MSSVRIRRLYASQNKWTDPNSKKHKHKHRFAKHAIVCLQTADGFVHYYNVMCCTQCHSFKSIPKEHNASGILIRKEDIDLKIPILVFRTSHKMRIGFSDLTFVAEKCVK